MGGERKCLGWGRKALCGQVTHFSLLTFEEFWLTPLSKAV